jgi:predicted dehydrogenase
MEGDYVHNLLYQAKQTDPVTGRNWYLEHELPLVGGGSHPLDLLRWVSGKEVSRVWGYSNHRVVPGDIKSYRIGAIFVRSKWYRGIAGSIGSENSRDSGYIVSVNN